MSGETCGVCGGDGQVSNSFGGGSKRCPGCNGTGRRSEDGERFHDVTKTKPSHHRPQGNAPAAEKQTWPSTFEGGRLAQEVQDSAGLSDVLKARLVREIIEYETSHGTCTKTFSRKIRKQIRDQAPTR